MKMPAYEIFIDGKPRKVELTKTSEKSFAMKVDDKSLNVELKTDNLIVGEQFSIKIGDKAYAIELQEFDRTKVFPIRVEEATFKAEVRTPTTKTAVASFEPTPLASVKRTVAQKQVVEGAVEAPMTGKIVSVKVNKGDKVKAGQVLCVIEAMKMENEITASKPGSVQEVNVSEGSSVNEGEILFVIG
jgi:biotin carboxyl carrier protein